MTGGAFLAYVGQFLAPTISNGDVVVVDNLAALKSEAWAKQSESETPAPLPRDCHALHGRPASNSVDLQSRAAGILRHRALLVSASDTRC